MARKIVEICLGKVPFGDEYIEALNVARNEQVTLRDVELEVLGIDHQEVGQQIAEKWKLNEVITSCIVSHHDPGSLGGDTTQAVALVALGNFYTNIHDHGFAGNRYPSEEGIDKLLELAGISWHDFSSIGNRVIDEIHKAEIFLQI